MVEQVKTLKQIILASASETRYKSLASLGIDFVSIKPSIDEDALKQKLCDLSLRDLGFALARAKAQSVSLIEPDAFVIAADQIAQMDKHIFDKPLSRANCLRDLKLLSASTHYQHCFLVLYHQGDLLWEHYSFAELLMRKLTDREIVNYIDLEEPFNSCGSFMFEKHGKHLFEWVRGDQDTILGLPLVPLLNKLYELEVLSLG
jgi:septum formation protein